jgi:predicted metalloprotease
MRWQGRNESSNIDDRRGEMGSLGRGSNLVSMAFFFWPLIKMLLRTKLGWAIIAIGVVAYLAGFSPIGGGNTTKAVVNEPQNDEQKRFIATVLKDTELVWEEVLRGYNRSYPHPTLVLFRGATHSGCGNADVQTGPFYCPADEKIYIDLSFFDELKTQFNATGDFAQAYVLAHEVGHHIQHILGILEIAHKRKMALHSKADNNAVQVQVELQADCLAGVWAYHANQRFNILEQGDIEEAINAASAIGDDTLQKRSQGHVVPDAFTHGSSAQRVTWFKKGFESGNINICKTL